MNVNKKRDGPCGNCGIQKVRSRGLCAACYKKSLKDGSLDRRPEPLKACKECGDKVIARGVCWKHYQRMLRAGKPKKEPF